MQTGANDENTDGMWEGIMKARRKSLFTRLKKLLFGKKDHRTKASGQGLQTKTCPSCGKTILYDPNRKYIPNYCADCSTKYRSERGMITRTCKVCGKTFTLPENVQHWPDICQECRAKYRPVETITRKCRKCGKTFTFRSDIRQWPKYCPECQKKRR